jgi:AcrR family transcriptional regulator
MKFQGVTLCYLFRLVADRQVYLMDRIPRAKVDKFAERRMELGKAALMTLAELGYARTSLREIAQNSEFSHGVLHYYFRDKLDLILCSVRQYKARCVTRYDEVVANARDYDELLAGFLDKLSETVREEAPLHRLWYDLRAQALFEDAFRSDVMEIDRSLENMVARIIDRFAQLTGTTPKLPPPVSYALFDGLFQQCLLKHLAGDPEAIPTLQAQVTSIIGETIALPQAA